MTVTAQNKTGGIAPEIRGATPVASPFDIHVPSTPKHLVITQTMIEDFIIDPVMGVEILFNEKLDEFQKVRLIQYVHVPRVMDSSGFSSFKTATFWMAINLRALLIGDHVSGIYYQNFNVGQKSFWSYYDRVMRKSALFRAQVGRMAADMSEKEGKGTTKGASCWNCYYKNAGHGMLPAPGFLTDAASQASIRFNDLGIDEWTKIDATGSTGIDDQLIGRSTRESFNQHHPFWCNHHMFLATAEDTMHPAHDRYKTYMREVNAGNPDYSVFSFSFKDISDRPYTGGKTFKQALRNEKVLADMKKKHTKSKYQQEVLGLWSKNGRRWYDPDALEECVALGKRRGLLPLTARSQDQHDSEEVRYFLGGDPSKGDRAKADDGALVALRVEPRIKEPTDSLTDWKMDFVWAYKVRKADSTQWASLIHLKDRHFKWTGICLDHGGGGQWIRPELAKSKQIIDDQETHVVPICTPDDYSVNVGNHCLIMFSHGDPSIKKKWETLKGADNLIDNAHCEMREIVDHANIGFPERFQDRPKEETNTWSDEKVWANRLLDLVRAQLGSISVAVDDKGDLIYTRNNAHQFQAKGRRKDFAYAAIHAVVRFLVWLKLSDDDYEVSAEDAAGGE
jgi:hypothetical protein